MSTSKQVPDSDKRQPRDAMPDAAQLPLALRYPPDQRLETYVAAIPGTLAQLQALASGDDAAWSYVAGAAGTGKTHLLLATCAAAEAVGRRAAYLPLKAAVGRVREALDALEGNDLIALDDLEAVVGRREDEVALFEFHNRASGQRSSRQDPYRQDPSRQDPSRQRTSGDAPSRSGIVMLYSARAAAAALAVSLPDLRSRLSQCVQIGLRPLDDDGRREVLRSRAQRRGLVLEDAALDWVLKRTGRDLSGLTALLDRLDRASLVAKRRMTVRFLRQVLAIR